MPLTPAPAVLATLAPPVMEARRWLAETVLPANMPLLNLSQAAPVEPPPLPLREAMAQAILTEPATHLYSPVLGNPALRAALAARTAAIYGGRVEAAQVALTAGCNQAFCTVVSALCAPGDAVILPTPWYFNHQMWLSLNGIEAVALTTGAGLLPDPDRAAALIGPRTRAIALVSPNNPGGVEYPPALIAAFAALCARHGIALILDETYRDFHAAEGAPHGLFADPAWDEVLVHLYSFSKAFRLTGHRVGAILAAPHLLAEVEKVLDTVTICVSGPGQMAALWGLTHLTEWLAGERAEVLRRRQAITATLGALPGWDLVGCGAYFAYVRHPFDAPAPAVARRLLAEAGVLVLPGTMFRPADDPAGLRELRIAFANADSGQIADLGARLRPLT